MNVKKLSLNILLMSAVALAPMGLSSCSDDDDGGGGPSVSEGEADVQVSGAENTDITGSGATFTEQEQSGGGQTTNNLIMNFSDTAGNSLTVTFTAAGDNASLSTGTYEPLDLDDPSNKFVSVSFSINGTAYSSIENGNVELLTKSEESAAAKFNDLEVSAATSDDAVTVNGEINASKNGGGSSLSVSGDILLSIPNAENDTLSLDGEVTNESDPVEHKAVSLGGGDVKILIVPQDVGSGSLDLVTPGTLTGGDAADQSAAVQVSYDGKDWTSVAGEGSISVTDATMNAFAAAISNVQVESDNADNNVTISSVNGPISSQ